MSFLHRHFLLLACALIGMGLLSGLGVWQLQRLAWKETVLAQISARRDALPQALPPQKDWAKVNPDDYDYRHVIMRGVFDHARESFLFRASATGAAGEGPGYEVLTPLALDDGGTVIVNRGFAPAELKEPARRAASQVAGEVTISGLMRRPEARNAFTPADEPDKNLWFTRDPAALAAHWGLQGVAPFSVDADTTPNPGGWPKGGATVMKIPNNHLAYALTWFALATTLAAVTAVFIAKRERTPKDMI